MVAVAINCIRSRKATELAAIDAAWTPHGSPLRCFVLVAGAGNYYGTAPHYPAAYDHVIAVASTDWHDNLSSFSTFGNSWVDMAAPGSNISSVVPDELCATLFGESYNPAEGCQDWYSGTSMARPHVAGVATMVWSQLGESTATNAQVRSCIENSGQTTGALGQNFQAWVQHGRVNLYNAINCSPTPPPPQSPRNDISDMYVSSIAMSKSGNPSKSTLSVTVNIRRDSDAPVGYTDADAPVAGVALHVALCPTGISPSPSCNFWTSVNTTDSNGNAKYKL